MSPELTLTIYVLSAFVLLFIGALAGWLFGDRNETITESRLRTGIAIVITAVWVITIIAEIVVPTYTTALVIHAIMGAVVGYLFSENGLRAIISKDK